MPLAVIISSRKRLYLTFVHIKIKLPFRAPIANNVDFGQSNNFGIFLIGSSGNDGYFISKWSYNCRVGQRSCEVVDINLQEHLSEIDDAEELHMSSSVGYEGSQPADNLSVGYQHSTCVAGNFSPNIILSSAEVNADCCIGRC